jgi:hypothetical protein
MPCQQKLLVCAEVMHMDLMGGVLARSTNGRMLMDNDGWEVRTVAALNIEPR